MDKTQETLVKIGASLLKLDNEIKEGKTGFEEAYGVALFTATNLILAYEIEHGTNIILKNTALGLEKQIQELESKIQDMRMGRYDRAFKDDLN